MAKQMYNHQKVYLLNCVYLQYNNCYKNYTREEVVKVWLSVT